MELIISLTKEVPDEPTGQALYEIVLEKLSDHPEVKIQGRMTANCTIPMEPE